MKYILPRLQLILLVLPALLLAGSCNKEKTQQPGEGEYFVKFKVNGQQKVFTTGAAGPKKQTATNGKYLFSVTGNKNTAGGISDHTILITLLNDNLIKAGTYRNSGSSTNLDVGIIYIDESATSWSSVWVTLNNWKADAEVIIDELNEEYVKGRFSSSVYRGDQLDAAQSITEGSFFVPVY